MGFGGLGRTQNRCRAGQCAHKRGILPAHRTDKEFSRGIRSAGQRQYFLETALPAQILLFFEPGQQVVPPYNLRDAEFVAGLEFDGIFRLGSAWGSGERRGADSGGVRKETIFAHPPRDGETILQFLLALPQARDVTFAFSMDWRIAVAEVMARFSKCC